MKRIWKESPTLRAITFLLNGREYDYSMTDIAEGAEMARITAYAIIDKLLKGRLVMQTRKQGISKLYKINMKAEEIKKFFEIYKKILNYLKNEIR